MIDTTALEDRFKELERKIDYILDWIGSQVGYEYQVHEYGYDGKTFKTRNEAEEYVNCQVRESKAKGHPFASKSSYEITQIPRGLNA